VYPVNQSFLPNDTLCGPKTPVHTLNEGTKDYIDSGMEALIKDLDILSLVKKFGNRESLDKNRGNFQRNFGVSCGQMLAHLQLKKIL
jgi:hypothetical protein